MKKTADIMGMPTVIEIIDPSAKEEDFDKVFDSLRAIDQRFSTYKKDSEIEKINRGEIKEENYSEEMKKILKLSEQTKEETNGYFDIVNHGKIDPSGIVKGYAIFKAANLLREKGYRNFYVEIAGDVEISGLNHDNKKWKVGIQNPFNTQEIIKVVNLTDCGIATSGTYRRGSHIYNPKSGQKAQEVAGLTVIGPNVYEADRFATAAFAMGEKGIEFIETLNDLEGYMITNNKIGIQTSGFEKFL